MFIFSTKNHNPEKEVLNVTLKCSDALKALIRDSGYRVPEISEIPHLFYIPGGIPAYYRTIYINNLNDDLRIAGRYRRFLYDHAHTCGLINETNRDRFDVTSQIMQMCN